MNLGKPTSFRRSAGVPASARYHHISRFGACFIFSFLLFFLPSTFNGSTAPTVRGVTLQPAQNVLPGKSFQRLMDWMRTNMQTLARKGEREQKRANERKWAGPTLHLFPYICGISGIEL